MNGRWFGSGPHPIGLDLGSSSIRMLQLAAGTGGPRLTACGRYDLPAGLPVAGPERQAALRDACRRLLPSLRLRRQGVIAALPESALRYKNIRLPRMPADELDEAVRWEAADRFGDAHQALAYQYVRVGELAPSGGSPRQELIVMAAEKVVVDEYVSVLAGCGLRLAGLEATPTALASCLSSAPSVTDASAEASATQAVLDLGAGGPRVLLLRDGQVVLYRPVDLSGSPGPDVAGPGAAGVESQSPTGLRPEIWEEVVRQVGLCLRYDTVTFRGQQPAKLWLSGGGAAEPGLERLLNDYVEIEVRRLDPLAGVRLGPRQEGLGGPEDRQGWAVATGLALRGLGVAHTARDLAA